MKDIIEKINRNSLLLYVNVALFFLLVNGLASSLSLQLDLSANQVNSISDSSEQVINNTTDRILIEAYISRKLPGPLLSQLNPILSQLKAIERIGGGKIQYTLINPNSKDKQLRAQERGVQPLEVTQHKLGESKIKTGYFGVYVQVANKSTVINIATGDQQQYFITDFEYRFLREIKSLTRKRAGSGIAFAQGNGLFRNQQPNRRTGFVKDSMFVFEYFMQQDGIRLDKVPLALKIPEKVNTLLVVGLPRLNEMEIYNLDQFLVRGGNVVCLLQGYTFQLEQAQSRRNPRMPRQGLQGLANVPKKELAELNSWLGRYGVSLNGEILFEFQQYTLTFDFLNRDFRPLNNPAWGGYQRDTGNLVSSHAALKDQEALIIPWFSSLDVKEVLQPHVAFQTLVQTSPEAVTRQNASLTALNLHQMQPRVDDKRVPHPMPVAVMAQGRFQSAFTPETLPQDADATRFRTGKENLESIKPAIDKLKKLIKEQQDQNIPELKSMGSLTVIGTPYLVSDVFWQNRMNTEYFQLNQIFLANLLEAIGGDTDLLAARARVKTVKHIKGISGWLQSAFKYFNILFIPLVLALLGTLRLMRRNRRLGLEGPISNSNQSRNSSGEDS